MYNAVSAETYDILGHALIEVLPKATPRQIQRRTARVRTLDGGVAVNDGGFSDGDRTIDLAWRPRDEVTHNVVSRLLQLYPRVVVSTAEGVFLAAPETYTPGTDESRLRLLVLSRLSA
jgi:hypothetical protein